MLEIAIAILCAVESANNPAAVGDMHMGANHARGVLQIRPIVIADVNRHYGTSWTPAHAYDRESALVIARQYLTMYCGTRASLERYCRVWNGGPNGHKRRTTLKHWARCRRAYELASYR